MCDAVALEFVLLSSLLFLITIILTAALRRHSAATHVHFFEFAFACAILITGVCGIRCQYSLSTRLDLWVGLVWACGCVAAAALWLRRVIDLRLIYRRSRPLCDRKLMNACDRLKQKVACLPNFEVRAAQRLSRVAVARLPSPAIMIPAEYLQRGPKAIERMLLAACPDLIRSRRLTLLAELLRALFWFHPLAWYLTLSARYWSVCSADDRLLLGGIKPRQLATAVFESEDRTNAVCNFAMRCVGDARLLAILHKHRERSAACHAPPLILGGIVITGIVTMSLVPVARSVPSTSPQTVSAGIQSQPTEELRASGPARTARLAAALRRRLGHDLGQIRAAAIASGNSDIQDEALALQHSVAKLYASTNLARAEAR